MHATVPKPRGLTDEEWAEIRRAAEWGYFRYVFCTWTWLHGLGGLALGIFGYHLIETEGNFSAAFAAAIESPMFAGIVSVALFAGLVLRSIDWFGQRRTVALARATKR